MGELERTIAIVGAGRLGTALAAALGTARPHGRGADARGADVVLLCVPDAGTAGVKRELLAPLVRATVDNWASLGAIDALTGPIVRGDSETVERHRVALGERTPDLLPLYDELARATRALVAR